MRRARLASAALLAFAAAQEATSTAPMTPTHSTRYVANGRPPDGPWLEFDLFLTARSPVVRFDEAKDWFERHNYSLTDWGVLLNGAPLPESAKIVRGEISHQLLPHARPLHSRALFPLIGRALRVEGAYNSTSELFRYARDDTAAFHPVVPPPHGGVLYADALDSSEFTRRRAWLYKTSHLGRETGTFSVANATVSTGMRSDAGSLLAVPTYFLPFVTADNSPNPAVEREGDWTVSTSVPGGSRHRTLVGRGGARLRLRPPPGTAFLIVNGTAGPEYGPLRIGWENWTRPTLTLDIGDYAAANLSRPYYSPGEVVYYVPLDPGESLSFNLGPDADAIHGQVALHSVTFYAASRGAGAPFSVKAPEEWPGRHADEATNSYAEETGAAPKKTNVGAIVGGVIGGIAALALLVVAVILLNRRRRETKDSHRLFEIESPQDVRMSALPDAEVTPYAQTDTSTYNTSSPDSHTISGSPSTRSPPSLSTSRQADRNPSVALSIPHEAGAPLSPLERDTKRTLNGVPLSPVVSASPRPVGQGVPLSPAVGPRLEDFERLGPTHEEDAGRLLPPNYNPAWRDE